MTSTTTLESSTSSSDIRRGPYTSVSGPHEMVTVRRGLRKASASILRLITEREVYCSTSEVRIVDRRSRSARGAYPDRAAVNSAKR